MISVKDYAILFEKLGREYFISDVRFVPDLRAWAQQNGIALSEPAQFMKLTAGEDRLVMTVQSEVREAVMDGIITGLDVRWQVVDNAVNLSSRLDTVEKRLAYCFLKEYARTQGDLAGDELLEDGWALKQMEKLGVFEEKALSPDIRTP